MPRSVPLWSSDNHDAAIPTRVRLRVFERCGGRCHRCSRKLGPADRWSIEHLIALANGGKHAEDNMALSCEWCKPLKDAEDVAIKSKGARIRANYVLPRQPSRLKGAGFPRREKQHSATRPIRWRGTHQETAE